MAFACLGLIVKASGLTVHPKPRWGFLQARDPRRLAFLLVLLVILSATWEGSVSWASWGICPAAQGFLLSVLDLALMPAPPAPRLFLHNSLYTPRRGSQSLAPAFIWVEETKSRNTSLVLCLLTRVGLQGFAVNESNPEDSEGKRHCDKLVAAQMTCCAPCWRFFQSSDG